MAETCSPAFKARAEKFKAERSKAWREFLDDSTQAGYTIEDSLANRVLFMAGYESGKAAAKLELREGEPT